MIYCEHPVIIYNPYIKYLLIEHRYIRLFNKIYVYDADFDIFRSDIDKHKTYSRALIAPKCNNISLSDAENAIIFNRKTGETYPLYMIVPCQHCDICRKKKIRDWECRAMAETCTSISVPLFIRLSYNNENLPKVGVIKQELIDFIRKFRDYCRYHYDTDNIRFIGCGEYGKNTHRAHYHVVLWNVPFMKTWQELIDVIEVCWKKGFITCKPCNSGCVSYVCKYMNKLQDTDKTGQNPPFFHSSRRNGIGYQWIEDNKKFFRLNPTLTMQLTDPFNKETKTFGIPRYFIDKIYPQISKLVPKEIRNDYERFLEYDAVLHRYQDDYVTDYRTLFIKSKFMMLPCHITNYYPKHVQMEHYKKYYLKDGLQVYAERYQKTGEQILKEYYELQVKLLHYRFPLDFDKILKYKEDRKHLVDMFIDSQDITEDSVKIVADRIRRANQRILDSQTDDCLPF